MQQNKSCGYIFIALLIFASSACTSNIVEKHSYREVGLAS